MSRAATPATAPPPPANDALLQRLLDALLEAACWIDGATLTVGAANAAACTLWGHPMAQLIGMPATELGATPEDQLFWFGLAAWPAATPLHSDSLVMHAQGEVIEVERRISAMAGADERPGWLLTALDQRARRQAEREVERLLAEQGATLAGSQDAVLITDLAGQVRNFNEAFRHLWRLPAALVPLADQGEVASAMRGAMADAQAYDDLLASRLHALHGATCTAATMREALLGAASGGDRLALADGRVLERRLLPQYARGAAVGWVQVWRDLSAQLAQQQRLELAAQVMDSTLDAILVTDGEGQVVAANPAAVALCGLSAQALQERRLHELLRSAHTAHDLSALWPLLAEQGRWQGELELQAGGAGIPVTVSLQPVAGSLARGCIAVLADGRERRAAEQRLDTLAHTDALTGLANRLLLHERLDEAVMHEQAAQQPFALLMFNLDRFKDVNNSLGHPVGDRVLVEIGHRLVDGVRLGDTVARLAGDNFAVLLRDADQALATRVAQRLRQAVCAELRIDDLRLSLGTSVGVALYPADGGCADELLKNAESALHENRQRRGSDVSFYQPQMSQALVDRVHLVHAMRQALERGDFQLHFQPQVDLASGGICGAEALCRWLDPQQGLISPTRFIPVAEKTGFIGELGDWVLRAAVRQAAQWRRAGLQVPVSVNVSVLQFQQPGFIERVAQVLAESGLPGDQLELELTESTLAGDVDELLSQLHTLAALGVRMAIDDFGTGYSNLAYLRRLPIHRLKIDRSFVQNLPADASDAAITRAIVEMARALRLRVIAEGVETEAQRAHLAAIGCDEFQGWLCSPALTAGDFERLLDPAALAPVLRRLA